MKAYMDFSVEGEDDLVLEVDGEIVKEIKGFSKGVFVLPEDES